MVDQSKISTSPFAPAEYPILPEIEGLKTYTYESGIKYQNRPDVFFAVFGEPASVAGVFTKSSVVAHSVKQAREKLKIGEAKALLVNAGNANCFTGEHGIKAVEEVSNAVADFLECKTDQVFSSSTGVIGEKLDYEKITNNISKFSESGWLEATQAITTTDTFYKLFHKKVGDANICGIAKGSGMIEPNMATMLAYIFTDAKISSSDLQKLLNETNEESFNSITVDSDSSTNDTVLAFATNKQEVDSDEFASAFAEIMTELAQQIVKDGEGITKFIEVEVSGATDKATAKKIAKSIANSPLVKTAIAGEDPNWGRVMMALGKTGIEVNQYNITLKFGDILVAKNGAVAASYSEDKAAEYMKSTEIKISIDLGNGKSSAKVWTCDLTHQYITINADYRS